MPGDESRKLACSPHGKVSGETDVHRYAYGWRIRGDQIWHSGGSIGFRNVILRWPKQRPTMILISNRNDPQPYDTVRQIARLFLHHRIPFVVREPLNNLWR
ncbi:MAG: hypothetical protein C4338_01105 [Rhodanobacteraceae bacterium]